MRNLFFILKTYHRFFIFLVLEIICLIIFFRNNDFQYASYIHSAQGVTAVIYDKKENISSYLLLKTKNEKLLTENAKLRSRLGLSLKTNPLKDTAYQIIASQDSNKQTIYYSYIPARVLNNSIDKKNNFITLDKGSSEGIKKNMSVIGADGVVGKISHVSEHYALASSMLSSKFNISCVTPNGTIGNVSWESEYNPEYVVLNGVPQSEVLKMGDTIITSGFSLFPRNVVIGRVVGSYKGGSTGMKRYKIKLATNFRRLNFVYIVDDQTTIERTVLEDSIRIDNNE